MEPQKYEMNEKRLIRWLLIATLALLVLVLGLQAWRMLFPAAPARDSGEILTSDASPASTGPQTAGPASEISSGKTAMIEDVQALNPSLSFDSLSALGAEELEQLCQTGAPGLPIGISAAASAAEEYAGTLAMDSVTWSADPELDENPAHYEVTLHHITMGDFEYKINAYTGEVLEGQANLFQNIPAGAPESESASAQAPASQSSTSQPSASQSGGGLIGEDAAKAAAFAHAGVAEADAAGLRIKLDWEDRVQVYEIEFTSGGKEYEYDIDAATGAVRKAEQEWDSSVQGSSSQTDGFIGDAAARSAALTHAGVSEADAGYIHWKLDQDDGRWLYEVEFRSGGAEYEYEIDAVTGAVLKAELDH